MPRAPGQPGRPEPHLREDHGEITSAWSHSWSSRLVAEALDRLSRGDSYAEVSHVGTPLDGRLLEAARTALWANLRLVIIDLETCASPGGGSHRVVEVAAVTCRRGATGGTWSTPVHPECPIDPVTRNVHGITDDLVADEPTFDAVAPQLVELLAHPRSGSCASNRSRCRPGSSWP